MSAISSSQMESPERDQQRHEEGSILSANHIGLFNSSSVDQSDNREIRLSHIEVIEAIPNDEVSVVESRNIQQITQTLTSLNNVTVLEQQLKDAHTKINQLVNELKGIKANVLDENNASNNFSGV